jgi:hypothetical protein
MDYRIMHDAANTPGKGLRGEEVNLVYHSWQGSLIENSYYPIRRALLRPASVGFF